MSDPATGAAAYMISGGIAGGSSSIAVDLASAVSMIIGVVMLIDAVCMLLAATTLIGGIIGFALAAFTIYYLYEVLDQMYMYYLLGDYNSGQKLIGEAILGIVGMVAGTVIGKIFEALGIDIGAVILGRVIKWLDDVGNGIATKLQSLGFSQKSIMEIAETRGVEGLEAVAEALELGNTLKLATRFDDALAAIERAVIKGAPDNEIYTLMENAVANKSWSAAEARQLQARIAEKGEWIGKYYNSDMSPKWPPNDGFAGALHTETMQPGMKFDRYGYPTGRFGSPVDTPYDSRALLPGTKETSPYNV